MVFNDLRKVDLQANLSQSEPWRSLNTSQTDIQRLKDGNVGGQVNNELHSIFKSYFRNTY